MFCFSLPYLFVWHNTRLPDGGNYNPKQDWRLPSSHPCDSGPEEPRHEDPPLGDALRTHSDKSQAQSQADLFLLPGAWSTEPYKWHKSCGWGGWERVHHWTGIFEPESYYTDSIIYSVYITVVLTSQASSAHTLRKDLDVTSFVQQLNLWNDFYFIYPLFISCRKKKLLYYILVMLFLFCYPCCCCNNPNVGLTIILYYLSSLWILMW